MGQLQQESNCRNVISRDGVGSEGLPQITFRVWKASLAKQGIFDIKSIPNQLKAHAYINYVSYKQDPYKHLWVTYQIYNGGTLVLKEIKRAGKVDWALAKKACSRKIIKFKDGSTESACDINYSYPKQIYKYGSTYKTIEDSVLYPFW